MARLPQLLDALAAADTRRERSWFDSVSRAIREDGLLPPSVRGRGATVLDVHDASSLLLASMAPVTQAEAATAARQFASLRRMPRSSRLEDGVFAPIAAADLFGDAVAAAISQAEAIGSELMLWTDEAFPKFPREERYRLLMPRVNVALRSSLHATISVVFDACEGAETRFATEYCMDIHRTDVVEFYGGPFSRKSDTTVTVEVGLPTLLRLHDALQDKGG